MSDKTVIKVDNISKSFLLSRGMHSVKSYFLNPIGALTGRLKSNRFKVLENIDFEVKQGDFVGVIGRNGSGKSTLLKMIAGIYTPDSGKIIVNGKIVPFLELGVGFNPALTGRENVFLNGVILGMTKSYIQSRYNKIVEFAELEKFMDTPVKNYSSGMLVRLAFSIAIQTDADIYILDEILAVGDAIFQQKSADVIKDLVEQGKTILFVSHDLKSVEKYCKKALWIEKGELKYFGSTDVAVNMYQEEILKKEEEAIKKKMKRQEKEIDKKVESKEILRLGSLEVEVSGVDAELVGEDVQITAHLVHNLPVELLNVVFGIYKGSGELATAFGSKMDGITLDPEADMIKMRIKRPNLLPGRYYINIALFGEEEGQPYYWQKNVGVFMIPSNKRFKEYRGSVHLDHEWEN